MRYLDARGLIQSGDVLAWTHRPLRSLYDLQIQIVRMFTRSEWSHVGLAWVVGGRLFVLEAVSAGVRIFPLSRAGAFTWVQRGAFGAGCIVAGLAVAVGRWTAGEQEREFWQICADYMRMNPALVCTYTPT